MAAQVLSVNAGTAEPTQFSSVGLTGIDKQPVESLEVRDPGPRAAGGGSGVIDDFIGDTRHHGGTSQAVYLVAVEELDHWSGELQRHLTPGIFGENITTQGLDLETLPLGTALRIGDTVVLEVRVPRDPCATFAGHMGERGWVKRFAARGRTGAYCAVLVPGMIRAGDPITVEAPDHGIDVMTVFRAGMGDLDLARAVLDAGVLVQPYADELAASVRARTRD